MARQVRRALANAAVAALILVGGLTATAATAATPTATRATTDAGGPIWQVRGSAGTVFIAGSMHLLRPGDSTLPPAFDRAYREAERLVMEVDVDDLDPAAAAAFTAQHATFPPGTGLRQALGEPRWQRASKAFSLVGLELETLDRLEPWAAALVYSFTGMAELGFDPQLGVEQQLKVRAAVDRKDIAGLETLEYQLGLFDALSATDQARLLEFTLDDAAGNAQDIDGLTAAWREGNATVLEELLLREYRRFPTLYEALVYRRNRNWMPQIEALLRNSDDCLVVVGAMHLVGEQGLIALLRSRGLAVEPLQLH